MYESLEPIECNLQNSYATKNSSKRHKGKNTPKPSFTKASFTKLSTEQQNEDIKNGVSEEAYKEEAEEDQEEFVGFSKEKSVLWDRMRQRTEIDYDNRGLKRWLTFVENPTFNEEKREVSAHYFPKIELSPSANKTLEKLKLEPLNYKPFKSTLTDGFFLPQQRTAFFGSSMRPVIGGSPINQELAEELRQRVYGSSIHSFSSEWQRNHFQFADPRGPHSFGLTAHRDGARGLLICINAYILKHLLFSSSTTIIHKHSSYLMSYDEIHLRECLLNAVCDILWKVGSQRRVIVVLPGEYDYVESSPQYRPDHITEKLHLFTFYKLEELKKFLKRHFVMFESPSGYGCILFLYSVALTRGLKNLLEDMDYDQNRALVGDNEELTISCINLLLSGRATPHVHNGSMIYDMRGEYLPRPIHGLQERSEIGFLAWHREQLDNPAAALPIGSMLKTPKYPIWLTRVNGSFGLLFCTNAELMSHWRTENRFTLFYYTGLSSARQCKLSINTRTGRAQSRYRPRLAAREELKKTPALEHCIHSKWFGALINWNGTLPFY